MQPPPAFLRRNVRTVTAERLTLPFDGRLSPDEQRLLEQFAFATDRELAA